MILLDTHVLIWLDQGAEALGEVARGAIEAAYQTEDVGVAAITFWEIGRLISLGRLEFEGALEPWRMSLKNNGFQELALDGRVALVAAQLDSFAGDPTDRIIAATAMSRDARLVTADPYLLAREELNTIDGTR